MTTPVTTFMRQSFQTAAQPVVTVIGLAVIAGVLVAHTDSRLSLPLIPLALAAVMAIGFEAPIVVFWALALLLGLASGDAVDSPAPAFTGRLYDSLLVYALVALLLVSLALNRSAGLRLWPGGPATVAMAVALIALASAARFGSFKADLHVARPTFLLVLSLITGYWLSAEYGSAVILKILVASGGLATMLGLYNIGTGHVLSFYDSSFIFLIGVTATLVLYSAVDIGFARFPFLIASALVIVFSLRRGTIIAVVITVLVTGLVKGRNGFGTAAALIAGVVVATEIVIPGLFFNNLSHLVGYFSGGSGNDFSVNYRKYETANAWLNVKDHWIGGIGVTTDWTLYRTFRGKFLPYDQKYLHNSYLWMWLRFSIVGLIAYVAFFVVSASALIRRAAPTSAVVIGSSIIGLAFAVATASFLTTTIRWPLFVGLIVGIGLYVRDEARATTAT